MADNLGAHGLAGFVESFSGDFVYQFCTATHSESHRRSKRVASVSELKSYFMHMQQVHVNKVNPVVESKLHVL